MSKLPRHQRGAAILTAMIIVTLVATLTSAMVWQQWRALQIEAAERARAQSAWILSGALDWARLILREDARTGGADHLGEPWAVPLAEARLSTFLAADRENTDDAPDAFLAGSITDAQSRWNLRNLIDAEGKIVEAEVRTLGRLCELVQTDPSLAERVATALQSALRASRSAAQDAAPLMPEDSSQLGWLGIDADALRRLAPYIVVLPQATPVNLNTAPREVIAAATQGLDLASAERLVQARQRSPFRALTDAQAQLPGTIVLDPARVSTSSSHFEVRGSLRIGDRILEERSLVQRRGIEVVAVYRQRVSATDGGGTR